MNNEHLTYGYGPDKRHYNNGRMSWDNLLFLDEMSSFERVTQSYDFLLDYSCVHNLYPASVAQPNPFSNKAMFIINTLSKMGVKYTVDIFTYEGNEVNWGIGESSHKLLIS